MRLGRRRAGARPRSSASRFRRLLARLGIAVLALIVLLTVAAVGYNLSSGDTVAVPALDAHGHYVQTGNLVTHYEQWGDAGTPIVLVHGFFESGSTWAATAAILGRTHRVFAPDIRGYGYTQRVGPYTLAADTHQLRDFCAALHLDAAHRAAPMLVGHSSGAAIVGDLARTSPRDVAQIVFMDGDGTPYGVGPGWIHRLVVDPYATAAIRLATRHSAAAARVYRSACGPDCPPFDATLWLRPFRVPHAVAGLKTILGRQLIGLSYSQEQTIQVPAAVLYGSLDPQLTAAQATATAARLRTSRIIAIPGAHHLGMISDPGAVARDLAVLDG